MSYAVQSVHRRKGIDRRTYYTFALNRKQGKDTLCLMVIHTEKNALCAAIGKLPVKSITGTRLTLDKVPGCVRRYADRQIAAIPKGTVVADV